MGKTKQYKRKTKGMDNNFNWNKNNRIDTFNGGKKKLRLHIFIRIFY